MLLAEIHGHAIAEAQNSEDYLTSAVFGHLRYLPPAVFWRRLSDKARTLPISGESSTLAVTLERVSVLLHEYENLDIEFWPSHPLYGIPDLILVFTGEGKRPIVVLIEVKLRAGKSGTGEYDQIARYLKLLDKPAGLSKELPAHAISVLVYLTERDSSAEIEESILACTESEQARNRVFQLHWQDIVEAAQEAMSDCPVGMFRMVLGDVSTFLRIRGLEYFNGYKQVGGLPIGAISGGFYDLECFRRLALPIDFVIRKARWANAG